MPQIAYSKVKVSSTNFSAVLDPNDLTLESYSRNVLNYFNSTIAEVEKHDPAMKEWIDKSIALIEKGDKILELGSATMRDASYIRNLGYKVECTDGAQGFVEYLNKLGEPAYVFNVLRDNFTEQHSMIFANGVFPHFSPSQASHALNKVHDILKKGGVLALSIKLGHGETFTAEKFSDYCYSHFWDEKEFLRLAEEVGFDLIASTSNRGSYPSHSWLNLILRKLS